VQAAKTKPADLGGKRCRSTIQFVDVIIGVMEEIAHFLMGGLDAALGITRQHGIDAGEAFLVLRSFSWSYSMARAMSGALVATVFEGPFHDIIDREMEGSLESSFHVAHIVTCRFVLALKFDCA
jgi:hypothetical protein